MDLKKPNKITKTKVMFIVPSLSLGGAERVVSILSDYLSQSYCVSIVILGADEPAYDVGVECIKLNTKISSTKVMKAFVVLERAVLLRKVIKTRSPDTIISFMESANIPTILATILLRRTSSLVVSVRNNPLFFPWFYRVVIRMLYGIPNRVIAPSMGIAKHLQSFVFKNRRIEFIPNPVQLENIKEMANMPVNYSFKVPRKYILAVGRLVHQKGFDRLIAIFSRLDIDNLYLVIIGDGEMRAELTDLVRTHDLEKRVIMPGTVKNPFSLYKQAMCLALTSRYEGWPNVINEAIACGCPVVSYRCKYGPEEILRYDNGFLIEEGDENGMIDAFNMISESEYVRHKVVANGLRHIQDYSVEKISGQWIKGGTEKC